MNRIPLLICGLLSLAPVAAQVREVPDSLRSIGDEIASLPESDTRVLSKARALLGGSILGGQYEKAGRILDFLDVRFDSTRIVTLNPRERMLAEFWTGRLDRILADPEVAADLTWEPAPSAQTYRRPRLTPERDLLLEDLVDHTRQHLAELIGRVRSIAISAEQKDFLRLFAAALIGPDPAAADGFAAFRRQMNDDAGEFLTMYPRSPYETFVRRYLRIVLRPSPWAYGLGIGLGGVRLEGDLSRWFTSGLSFDVWGEVSYRQWYLMLWMTLGAPGEVRSTFTYNEAWPSGVSVSLSGAALALGYSFQVSRSIVVTPHAGWAYVDISPPEQERTATGFDGMMDFGAAVAGVNIDLPILRTDDDDLFEGVERGYHLLRARLAVMPTSTHIPYAKGTIVSFTLSYGLFGRPVEREF